jgi:hypothetical protein
LHLGFLLSVSMAAFRELTEGGGRTIYLHAAVRLGENENTLSRDVSAVPLDIIGGGFLVETRSGLRRFESSSTRFVRVPCRCRV